MKALLQRVTFANVMVDNTIIGEIAQGILVFLGFEKEDLPTQIPRMVERILGYRIFSDTAGKMNLNVQNIEGGVLLIPQFTLAADTNRGMRPSFSSAIAPEIGETLFNQFHDTLKNTYSKVAKGQFGSEMKINLCNDGPVTFLLQL